MADGRLPFGARPCSRKAVCSQLAVLAVVAQLHPRGLDGGRPVGGHAKGRVDEHVGCRAVGVVPGCAAARRRGRPRDPERAVHAGDDAAGRVGPVRRRAVRARVCEAAGQHGAQPGGSGRR